MLKLEVEFEESKFYSNKSLKGGKNGGKQTNCKMFFHKLTKNYRSRLLYYPPPLELKKNFSDGFRWFEFEWGILRAELQTQFCLVKSRKPKEILRFSKNFQTGLCV